MKFAIDYFKTLSPTWMQRELKIVSAKTEEEAKERLITKSKHPVAIVEVRAIPGR